MTRPLEFRIKVGSADGDREEIDLLTRDLLHELRDQPVESAEIVHEGTAPPGTKGIDADTIVLLVKASATALEIVLALLQKRLHKTGGTIMFEGQVNGNPVKFQGAIDEFARLAASFKTGATAKA